MKNIAKENNPNARDILFIEDNDSHLAHAKEVLAKRGPSPLDLRIDYAATLEESVKYMENKRYDGVIGDLFFSDKKGGNERMYGTDIAQKVLDAKIPVVIVTSTHHHAEGTQPACDWARNRKFDLIDNTNGQPHKNVAGGLAALGYLIEAQKEDIIRIESNGYSKGPAYDSKKGHLTAGSIMNNINDIFMYAKYGGNAAQEELSSACKESSLLEKVVREYCPGILP